MERQAETGRFGNASDYVRDLIRRDQEQADGLHELQRLITEGVESGDSALSMEDIRRAALAALALSGMAVCA